MARNIAVADDVYRLLTRSKMEGESFSDVIRRNLGRRPLAELAGRMTITRREWARVQESLQARRRRDAARKEGLLRRMARIEDRGRE